jgi:hypothetical protein
MDTSAPSPVVKILQKNDLSPVKEALDIPQGSW